MYASLTILHIHYKGEYQEKLDIRGETPKLKKAENAASCFKQGGAK